jgi:hypothetical protein
MKNNSEQTDTIKIRIGLTLKAQIERIAEVQERTFAGQVRLMLHEWIQLKNPKEYKGASCAKTIRAKKETVGKLTKSV